MVHVAEPAGKCVATAPKGRPRQLLRRGSRRCGTCLWTRRTTMAQVGRRRTNLRDVAKAAPLAVWSLPVAVVHDVVEWAPVGFLDRGERAVRRSGEGDQHSAEPVLAQVELDQITHPGVVEPRGHYRNRRRRAGDALHPRDLRELLPVGADHEVPRLLVARRRRAPRGLQNPVHVPSRDLTLAVGPHIATGCDRIPRFHIELPQTHPEYQAVAQR